MAFGERLVSALKPARTARREGHPAVTPAFTWTALALGLWVLLGRTVDVHAHSHGLVDESFFTPAHFPLISGVVANGLFYAGARYRNIGRGYSLWQALPGQYLLSFAGVLLYGIGGVLDLIWHEFFGVEQGIEEVISPTHLLLITSGMILASGPLRSFLAQDSMPRGWKQLFPPITSALMALSGATLFTRFVNVWALTDRYVPHDIVGSRTAVEAYTVAGVLIPAALTTGTLLFLRQRMVLPFGAVTWVLLANALIMLIVRSEWTGKHALALLAAFCAGLLGDWLLTRATGSSEIVALRRFAFLTPCVCMLLFFVMLQLSAGLWWSIHMWLGASFMAGAVGLGMSALLLKKAIPEAT